MVLRTWEVEMDENRVRELQSKIQQLEEQVAAERDAAKRADLEKQLTAAREELTKLQEG